jgi:hypothetical protein
MARSRGGRSGYPISSGWVIRVLRNSGNENNYPISAPEKHYPQKSGSGSGYPIYPKSVIKVYSQTYIILHRLLVCVEFQLQVEKNNIL